MVKFSRYLLPLIVEYLRTSLEHLMGKQSKFMLMGFSKIVSLFAGNYNPEVNIPLNIGLNSYKKMEWCNR